VVTHRSVADYTGVVNAVHTGGDTASWLQLPIVG
jgi:hypothetical protein